MSGKPVRPTDDRYIEWDLADRLDKDDFLLMAKFAMDRAADSIMWVDHMGRMIYVNDTACSSLGYTREELLQMKVFDIDPDFTIEDFKRHKKYIRQHGVMRFESRHRAKDGRIFPVEISANYYEYKGGFISIVLDRDISERKEAEAVLKAGAGKYRAIFNNSPMGIVHGVYGGRVIDINPAMARMFGYSDREEMLGAVGYRVEAVYADVSDRENLLSDLLESPDGLTREIEFRRKDGSTFQGVLHTSLQSDAEGRPAFVDGTIEDITESKRAVEELRQREAQLTEVGRIAKIGGWEHDLVGQKVTWSLEFYRIMEIPPDQEPPSFEGFVTYIHPDDRHLMQQGMERAIIHGESFDVELRGFTEKGKPFWGRAIGYPVLEDGGCVRVFGAFQDITERKRAEEALRMSEEKFSTLFRLSPDSVMLIDLETKTFVDVNDAFARRSGYPREEIIGKTSPELGFYLGDTVRDTLYDQLAAKGHVEGLEAEFMNKDGARGTYSLSATHVAIGGRPHVLAIAHNITDLKRMQEMMVQTEKMLSVGGIAAGVAHEINNPLGIILQAAQNLQQRSRPDFPRNKEVADTIGLDLDLMAEYMLARKLDVFIEDICNAALRASVIIRHLLNFSRRSESRRAVCDITSVIDGAIALANSDFDLRKSYDFKKIHVHVSMDDHLPQINCTDTEIEQVLLNLLRNAAQAMSTAEPPRADPRIDIRVQGRDGWIRIEVQDNGPGMSKEMQQRIFEPFFTTKAPGVGTGLGLSVSYFIITTGHGGRFTVASEPGRGALFTIDLPTETMRETP